MERKKQCSNISMKAADSASSTQRLTPLQCKKAVAIYRYNGRMKAVSTAPWKHETV
jgi:hypothetical protein